MVKQSKLVTYLHNATDFCNLLRRFLAKETFYLLSSKVTSDVLEIIDFLVLWSTFECQSNVYKKLEKHLFSLIWSNDKNISNAVINAFKRICLKIDEENTDEKISSKRIIEKLLDQIDLNLTLTFEHILKQLLNESTSTTANFFSFIEVLLDYYLKLTTDNSKKNLSDDFFKQIQQPKTCDIEVIDDEEPTEKATRLFDNMVKQSKLVTYLHNATDFCNLLRRFLAKETFYLLSSKVTSDVLEIIEFLVLWSTFECQSNVYKKLEKHLFSLIWSNDKNISNAVINAFKRICLKIDEENTDEKISSKRIIEKLLDQIDLNLTLTFEHILKQLLNESTSTTANFFSFIEVLLDYYLKLTTDNSKKHLSDDFFKQIQQRKY
ncbi:unnamed protein product [Adineta steineri]|uniref:Uncharacterized protein n=1 Tax=Adineta steineri TaxID=433720 RepID=A0A814EI05_9BILA|nr:unnamed protein product [Adineta steineri]